MIGWVICNNWLRMWKWVRFIMFILWCRCVMVCEWKNWFINWWILFVWCCWFLMFLFLIFFIYVLKRWMVYWWCCCMICCFLGLIVCLNVWKILCWWCLFCCWFFWCCVVLCWWWNWVYWGWLFFARLAMVWMANWLKCGSFDLWKWWRMIKWWFRWCRMICVLLKWGIFCVVFCWMNCCSLLMCWLVGCWLLVYVCMWWCIMNSIDSLLKVICCVIRWNWVLLVGCRLMVGVVKLICWRKWKNVLSLILSIFVNGVFGLILKLFFWWYLRVLLIKWYIDMSLCEKIISGVKWLVIVMVIIIGFGLV